MVYPTPTARRGQTFMLFAYPSGVQGNVVSAGVNEFIIPNYKQTWANIRKLADAPAVTRHLSFKSQEYRARLRPRPPSPGRGPLAPVSSPPGPACPERLRRRCPSHVVSNAA